MNLPHVVVATLFVASAVIIGGSSVALGGTASDPDPNSGSLIVDDDAGSPMFPAADLRPGDSVERCIEIVYAGTALPAAVSLYGSSGGTGLDEYLDLTIEEGTGGTFADCTGFAPHSTAFSGTLAEFAAEHTDGASGLQAWSPTSTPEARSYRFSVTLRADDSAQGLSATPDFFWEASSRHDG